MVTYGELKKHATKCYQDSEVFSVEEKVAERVLKLLETGHNVESVGVCLSGDVERLLLEGDEARAEVVRAFLAFIFGKQ